MEQFFKVRENITRCVYTRDDQVKDTSLFLTPLAFRREGSAVCPLDVAAVRFEPRKIFRYIPDGPIQTKETVTVDGTRTSITNLKEVFDRDAWRIELELRLDPREHIYGLGQDEDGILDKRGRLQYLYQHNMKIPMPVFVSSKGYGVLFNCACLMIFDDRGENCKITLECAQQLDFFVIFGTMDEIVAGIRELTGRAAPMPAWAMGYWQSKERYHTQQELLEVAQKYRDLNIPLDVIVQDWKTWVGEKWGNKRLDTERYPNIAEAMDALHREHVHALVSIWPNMNTRSEDHSEFAQRGLLLNDYSTYDAFSGEARDLYWEQAERELYRGGFDGWWCDNTEPFTMPDWGGPVRLPEDVRYELVGREHEKYLDPACANGFALEHARGIYEHQPRKPVVNLTRAGWAGISQYGAVLWAGDTAATWQELRSEIAKGVNVGLSGIPYWTVDCGGFFTGGTACWRKWAGNPDAEPVWFWHGDYDDGVKDKGYQELYTRWLQFSCFLPVFRSHGTDSPREVWNFQEPFRSAIAETIRLRYRLMPYIRELFRKVHQEHYTIMRGLVFDFPQDEKAALVDDEFMFGSDLLICPVLEAHLYGPNSVKLADHPMTRSCYLPSGTDWYDFHTCRKYEGGTTVTLPVTLERIPVFVRAGARIPLTEGLQYAEQEAPVHWVCF